MKHEESVLSKSGIAIYKTKDKQIKLEVKFEQETVWLNQAQMASLFEKGIPTINEHIKNIYKERELFEEATIRKSRIVQIIKHSVVKIFTQVSKKKQPIYFISLSKIILLQMAINELRLQFSSGFLKRIKFFIMKTVQNESQITRL